MAKKGRSSGVHGGKSTEFGKTPASTNCALLRTHFPFLKRAADCLPPPAELLVISQELPVISQELPTIPQELPTIPQELRVVPAEKHDPPARSRL
ncbi:MAG: hypothetical protein R3F13_19175 [Prosthecobacter sp.]